MTDDPGTPPLFDRNGPRATIRLNRPRYLNRLQAEDLVALAGHFDAIDADPAIRVMVLTGTGRAFSAGYDIGDLAARADGEGAPSVDFEALADRLENLRVPTICRLNGGVYGGSTDLALACDFRIGVEACEMFMPAARIGLHYYKSGVARYVTRLGTGAAKKLFLTARNIDAAEMLRIGYLDMLVAADGLDKTVDALADDIAANAPVAVAGLKRTINEIAHARLDATAADARHRESLRGAEIAEGMAAFAQKRKPAFR